MTLAELKEDARKMKEYLNAVYGTPIPKFKDDAFNQIWYRFIEDMADAVFKAEKKADAEIEKYTTFKVTYKIPKRDD